MFSPVGPEAGAPGPDPVAVARAAVDAVLGEDRSGWPAAAVGDRVRDLAVLYERVGAALATAAGAYDASGDWAVAGARSMISWLVHESRLSRAEAAAHVQAGRFAHHHDAAASALADGHLSIGHLRALARAVTPNRADLYRRDEAVLLDAARALAVDEFTKLVERWRNLADDTLADADSNARHDARELHVNPTAFGSCPVTGDLGPDGIIVDEALRHAMGDPDPAGIPGGPRTTAQRRADALVNICSRYLGTENTRASAPTATVDIIIDAATLAGETVPVTDARCETTTGIPLPVDTVRRFLCDSWAGRIILAADGEVLDVGTQKRLFTAAQRRAVRASFEGCAWPGCTAPHDWCQLHHLDLDPWNTVLHNAVPLCGIHHHYLHEGRWKLVQLDDGTWDARPP